MGRFREDGARLFVVVHSEKVEGQWAQIALKKIPDEYKEKYVHARSGRTVAQKGSGNPILGDIQNSNAQCWIRDLQRPLLT